MAEEAVKEAEARLQQKRLVEVVTQSHAGLGSFTPQISRGEEGCCQVQDEVRTTVEEPAMWWELSYM